MPAERSPVEFLRRSNGVLLMLLALVLLVASILGPSISV